VAKRVQRTAFVGSYQESTAEQWNGWVRFETGWIHKRSIRKEGTS